MCVPEMLPAGTGRVVHAAVSAILMRFRDVSNLFQQMFLMPGRLARRIDDLSNFQNDGFFVWCGTFEAEIRLNAGDPAHWGEQER